MSYDLMVFTSDAAPRERSEFMKWFQHQTSWTEEHSYDDPAVSSDNLKRWFIEMIETYPSMNGPYAKDIDEDEDNYFITDYSIGKDVIYAAFSWSLAEQAYEKMKTLAEKHQVGFFDVSANEGDILVPDGNGKNISIDKPGNLSSIQQIKKTAAPGQEDKTVKEIVYSKVLPQIMDQLANNQDKTRRRSWWKKILRIK